MSRTLGVEAVGQRSWPVTRFSRSMDGAETWDEPRTTFDPTGFGELEMVVGHRSAVLSDGTLVNLAEDFLAEGGSLLIQRSADRGGAAWTPTSAAAKVPPLRAAKGLEPMAGPHLLFSLTERWSQTTGTFPRCPHERPKGGDHATSQKL